MIRNIMDEDVAELQRIHEKYFADEFTFEDFFLNNLFGFLIVDDNDGSIVTSCHIRPIMEIVAITNYDKSARQRYIALLDMLQHSRDILKRYKFQQLHAFIQNGKWESQLIRAGFARTKGNSLYINL